MHSSPADNNELCRTVPLHTENQRVLSLDTVFYVDIKLMCCIYRYTLLVLPDVLTTNTYVHVYTHLPTHPHVRVRALV